VIITSTRRFASSSPWITRVARWATIVLPLAGGSVARGDDGLIASSGVLGLASSLGAMSDSEVQAIDARARSEAFAARAAAARVESQSLPRPASIGRVLPRPGGLPRVEENPAPAAAVFGPARPRSAAELRPAVEPARMTVPTPEPLTRPSVRSPAQIDLPTPPDSSRPVTDSDRPPMPFSRLLSQVRF